VTNSKSGEEHRKVHLFQIYILRQAPTLSYIVHNIPSFSKVDVKQPASTLLMSLFCNYICDTYICSLVGMVKEGWKELSYVTGHAIKS